MSGGGEFKDEHPVTEIIPGEVVVVKTSKGTFRTKKLVITAGAWAPALLKTLGVDLPFKVGGVCDSLPYSSSEPLLDFSNGGNLLESGMP